jgi:hypothetical protein
MANLHELPLKQNFMSALLPWHQQLRRSDTPRRLQGGLTLIRSKRTLPKTNQGKVNNDFGD